MTRSDATLCSWNSPAHLAGNTGLQASRSVSAKQPGWLQNFWTDAGTCVHCTNICPRHQPLWPATWSSASLTHGQAYHKTSLTKQLVNAESAAVPCKQAKDHFEHLLNWNLLFSEPPTVYRGKHVVLRHFHRSYSYYKVYKVVPSLPRRGAQKLSRDKVWWRQQVTSIGQWMFEYMFKWKKTFSKNWLNFHSLSATSTRQKYIKQKVRKTACTVLSVKFKVLRMCLWEPNSPPGGVTYKN